jgi:diadenosine tetraphosphate (Ap4A) HIT family hydrolase
MPADCPFCLSNNLLKSSVIASSPGGFLTAAAGDPGNYLIVPKEHAEALSGLPDDWWHDVKELLAQIPNLSDHYNMSVNVGESAGQSVKHLHFWIIPRVAGLPSSGKGLARLISEAS